MKKAIHFNVMVALLLYALLMSCASKSGDEKQNTGNLKTGALEVNIAFVGQPQSSGLITREPNFITLALGDASCPVCDNISFTVSATDMQPMSFGPYDYSFQYAELTGIPAGNGRKVDVKIRDKDNNLLYSGNTTNVTITAGETTTISIIVYPNAPTWQTAPSNINITSGSTYNQTDGIATDLDTGQTLTCSSNGTSCVGFTPVVSGSGLSPQACNVNFAAGAPQSCVLRITATDNGTPALSVGQTITITVPNRAPIFSNSPTNITITGGSVYNQTNGVLSDPDSGQTMACSSNGISCGFSVTITGSGAKPVSCNIAFTVPVPAQTCYVRVMGTDNCTTPATVGATISITVKNHVPIWQTAPSVITIYSGSTYNQNDGAATDLDAGQTLTCSSDGTSCIGFTPTVSGLGLPANCNVNFTAGTPQTCNLRITATDNGSPAFSVGQTITITVPNRAPIWSTMPSNITITSGSVYNQTNGVLTDPDSGETLTCSSGGTSCIGFTPTITGSSAKPVNCNVQFTAGIPQVCSLRVSVADDGSPTMSIGSTITITVPNRKPIFSTSPINIIITGGSTYNQTNAILTDSDTGQTLTCSNNGTSCGFTVTVTGSGAKPVNCNIQFTAPVPAQSCNVRVMGADSYTTPATVGATISITIKNHAPTWSTVPSNITITGGSAYNQTDGVLTDPDTGQTLTCSNNGTSCGFAITVNGSGASPRSCNVSFTAPLPAQTCNLRITATDNGSPAMSVGSTISITINDHAPTWSTAPTAISITGGSVYNQTDGTATDLDTSQTLTCSNNATSCGFTIVVSGSGSSPVNCKVNFTAPVPAGTCNLRIAVTDNGAPALSVSATITITIRNHKPTWSTAPTNITITSGSTYNQTDGVAADQDTGQTLTCSSNGTSCAFTPTVTGSGLPVNCNVSFTAGAPQTCNLRVTVTDNGSPAASIGSTITITVPNRKPTWSTTPSNITITGGSTYNTTDGVLTDLDTNQTLTCSSGGTSCVGFTPAVSGTGAKPVNCNVNFTTTVPAQTCNLRVVGADNGTPALSVGSTISITINNHTPTWSTAPSNITITGGSSYNQTNGVATDLDTGQTLICSKNGTSCGFAITVSGSGASPRSCSVSFTAPVPAQTCNFRIKATDNGSPAMSVGSTISITINDHAPTWSTTPSNITIIGGSVYNKTNGVATDLDTGQSLTCSNNGTSCGFSIIVSGSGSSLVNCNVSFTAPTPAQTCNLRVMAADSSTSALSVGQTISITVKNHYPTWSSAPSNITITGGSTYNQTNGIATDVDTGQTLTCSNNGTSCGFTITVTGTGLPANCNVNFTASVPAKTCNLRITATDNGSPAMSVGATIPITINNHIPTWSTAPSNITITSGSAYNATDGVGQDLDTSQALTCSGLTSCSFTVTVSGSSTSPVNCNVKFTAGIPGSCNLRLAVTDNGNAAMSIGSMITIIVPNRAPTWQTAPSNITLTSGSVYNQTKGVVTDPDSGQTLSCASNGTNCSFSPVVSGSGMKPLNCNISFAAPASAEVCNLRIIGADNYSPAATVGATIIITTKNNKPVWNTAPGHIGAATGQAISTPDGVATDPDAGQTLTCSSNGTSCSGFIAGPMVSGSSASPVTCTVGFTAPFSTQTCNLRIQVADNGSPALSVGQTITITISPNVPPTFSTAPSNITITSGSVYNAVNGVLSDPDSGQTLTCSVGSNSCTGMTFTYTGTGAKPVNCTLGFIAVQPQAACNLRLVGSDNYSTPATVGATITIIIPNAKPIFSTAPSNITITSGSAYSAVNGVLSDPDTGQTLTCSAGSTSCGFTVTVSGSSASPVNCILGFTSAQPQTCNLRLVGSDNYTTPATVGATITITIQNKAPIWQIAPTNVTIASGSVYSAVTGVLSDPDSGQTLTCSIGANSCSGITFTYTGTGTKPVNCTLGFIAAQPQAACNLRLVGSDNYTTPATVGATITIIIPNAKPIFSTAPSNITITSGSAYSAANGVLSDPDTGQTLTCSAGSTSCGFTVTVSGSSTSPVNCNVNFTAPVPAQTCNVRVMGADNYSTPGTVGATISITIKNHSPTWQNAPSAITIYGGSTYNQTDGVATDLDTGQTLVCSSNGTSCTFTPTVSGSGLPTNCNINFTAGVPQTCALRITATDNGSPALSVGQTITITVPNRAPTWSTVPSNITITSGSAYNQTEGVAADLDTGQTLTCSSNGTSCTFTPTLTGSGLPANCNVNFTAGAPQTCNLRITVTDNGSPALSVGQTITITVPNRAPTWSTTPSNITITGGSTYNQTDGVLTDPDSGQTLTCSSNGTSCGFAVTISGTGTKPLNCNIQFSAPVPAQTCNLRITATDNGSPAASVGATISITIKNHTPIWSTAPTAITITSGSTYNATDGIATDLDTGQTLTCSSNGTSCAGFNPTLTGSGLPANCNVNFTAGAPQTCALRIKATDNGSPALSTGQTITITVPNREPTWSTAPSNITITGGSTYNQTNVVLTDPDSGQTLSCSNNGTACGFTVTVTGSGAKPVNCNINFTAPLPAQTCNVRVMGADNYTSPATVGATISITIKNHAPTWSTTPSNITITGGSTYNQTNGVATDIDTSQTLTCSSNGTSCGFTITVSGSGSSPVNCNVNFTAPVPAGTCNLRIAVTDNGTPALSVSATITITIRNHKPTWSTAPSNITITGGSAYNQTDGVATDVDTSQTLTCSNHGTSCGFTITVTGSGTPPLNCNVSFTVPVPAGTCNLRIAATDNGTPALSVGVTISIKIRNHAATWSIAPSNITITGGSIYNTTNGTSTDLDTGETLTCSNNGTSCGFTVTVSGSGANPQNCNVNFTAPIPAGVCNLRIAATDNGTPALSVGQTIAITINNLPYWSPAPLDITLTANSTYNQINGHAIDPDTGQTLTCSIASATCSFITMGIIGNGPNTGVDCNITFTAGPSPENCSATIQVSDGVGGNITANVNIVIWQPISKISAGEDHTCALTMAGGVKCWGDNYMGELGDNQASGTQSNTPVDVHIDATTTTPLSGVAAISAGDFHTCALTTVGGIKCWGNNEAGQLGDNKASGDQSNIPVDVVGLSSGVVAISAGGWHTCALTTGGGIKCWGANWNGQLGDNTETDRWTPVDVVGLTSGVTAIDGGEYHTCALTTAGGVKCWGDNSFGELGDSGASGMQSSVPVDVHIDASTTTPLSGVAAISAGDDNTCALTTAGGVKCWGLNDYGELGDNTTTRRYTPVDVVGLTSEVTAISAGLYHTCALTTAGGVKCWGDNGHGELGDNTTTRRYTPVDVVGLTSEVAAISAGLYHTCALTTAGGVKCWGYNVLGELGDNTTTEHWTSVDVWGL